MAISGGLAFLGGVAQGLNKQYDEYYKESADMRKLQAALDIERYKTKKKVYDDNKEVWDILQPVVNGEVTGEPAFRLVQGAIDPEGKRTEVLRQMFNNNTLHHYLKSFEPGDEPTYESGNDISEPYRITNHPLAKLRANIFGEPTTTTDARAILFRQQAKKLGELNPEGKQIQGKLDIKEVGRGGTLVGVDAEGNTRILAQGQPVADSDSSIKVSNVFKLQRERDLWRQQNEAARYEYETAVNEHETLSKQLEGMDEANKKGAQTFLEQLEKRIEHASGVMAATQEKIDDYSNILAGMGQYVVSDTDEFGGGFRKAVPRSGVGEAKVLGEIEQPQNERAAFNAALERNVGGVIARWSESLENSKVLPKAPLRADGKRDIALPPSARFAIMQVYKDKVAKGQLTAEQVEQDLASKWRVYLPNRTALGIGIPFTQSRDQAIVVPKEISDDQAERLITELRNRKPGITNDQITLWFNDPKIRLGLGIRDSLGIPNGQ